MQQETSTLSYADCVDAVSVAFKSVLGLEEVDPNCDFFQLGGHSLHAAKVINHLRATCCKELTFEAFFEAPTVFGLAASIERAKPARLPISRFARRPKMFLDRLIELITLMKPELSGKISPSTRFSEAGFSSLDLVQLVLRAEKQFGVNLIDARITSAEIATPEAFASLLAEQSPN